MTRKTKIFTVLAAVLLFAGGLVLGAWWMRAKGAGNAAATMTSATPTAQRKALYW